MAGGIVGVVQNLDKRVGALESEGLEESATLTQINKLYADIEVEVTFRAYLHRYHMCGTKNRGSVTNTGAAAEGGGNYNIRVSPDLML